MNDDPKYPLTTGDSQPANPADASAPSPSAPSAKPKPAKPLTPEEQMALYEEKLKEDDWGHQPC
jgi:hypothetical protein